MFKAFVLKITDLESGSSQFIDLNDHSVLVYTNNGFEAMEVSPSQAHTNYQLVRNIYFEKVAKEFLFGTPGKMKVEFQVLEQQEVQSDLKSPVIEIVTLCEFIVSAHIRSEGSRVGEYYVRIEKDTVTNNLTRLMQMDLATLKSELNV